MTAHHKSYSPKVTTNISKKCAGIILNETNRIKHIMQNIRMLSEMTIEYSAFNLPDFLEELQDSLSVLFPDIRLQMQVEPSLTEITADRKKTLHGSE